MTMRAIHLLFELAMAGAFVASAFWAVRRWRYDGLWLAAFLFALGAVRENFVALARMLYGFADLTFELGAAPLIAAVVWGFSILAAISAGEALGGRGFAPTRPPDARQLGLAALFLVALAGFYEPLLARADMARWEPGTLALAGVPLVALVGYPSLGVAALALSGAVQRRFRAARPRLVAYALATPALALGHAVALGALKRLLGW
jgi:hypothetical protein